MQQAWLPAVAGLLGWVCAATAQTPVGTMFTYQGELKVGGSPLTGNADVRFTLHEASSGGAQVGSMLELLNVPVASGRFTAALDFGINVFEGHARWLQIALRAPAGSGAYTTLSPRQALTAAPYALFAVTAQNAGTATTAASASNALQLNGQGAGFYQDASNLNAGTLPGGRLAGAYGGAVTFTNAANSFVGAGTSLTGLNASNLGSGTVPDARLSGNVALLSGAQTFSGAKTFSAAPVFTAPGAPFSVASTTPVTNLTADRLDGLHASAFLQSIPFPLVLSGSAPGSAVVAATNDAPASYSAAVSGKSTSPTGYAMGGSFESASPDGDALYVDATAASGSSVTINAQNRSAEGIAVHGAAGMGGPGTSYGGWFMSASSPGVGVFGVCVGSGATYGGRFVSTTGYGAKGETNDTSIGTLGMSGVLGTGGTGVRGQSPVSGGNGVVGIADGPSAYGVYGNSSGGYAGYFSGPVYVTGLLNKAGGGFKIDHPLAPEAKYLVHSFVESPDMMNVYTGVVTIGDNGSATIELPSWFETINRDFRYQLTCIGAFAPVYIGSEVAGNRFTIAGGVPGLRVSWQVTGIRKDPWAEANRMVVEQDKPEAERGYLLHPELYGFGPERGMEAAKRAISRRLADDPAVKAEAEAHRREMERGFPRRVRAERTPKESQP